MTSRFFCIDTLPETGDFCLPDPLVHHAVRVLRMGEGDAVVLFDGRGGEVAATLFVKERRWHARIDAHSMVERESPLELVLVQALASGDKMDWILQKAVELGVTSIVPVRAERSVLRLSPERAIKREAHWRQVVISACEQSGRNCVPTVAPITDLTAHLRASVGALHRFVLDPTAAGRLVAHTRPDTGVQLLVGPEGGWTDGELAACRASGCTMLSLGPRVLRTETAGLAALATIQALWGDF